MKYGAIKIDSINEGSYMTKLKFIERTLKQLGLPEGDPDYTRIYDHAAALADILTKEQLLLVIEELYA